jgi:hypothetical protein
MKINVLQPILSLALLLSFSHAAPSQAVEAFNKPSGQIQWSKVINDSGDGPIVYDRNDGIYSSWSKAAIRFTQNYSYQVRDADTTETRLEKTMIGKDSYGNPIYRDDYKNVQVPHYHTQTDYYSPTVLQFSINGKDFTYTSGVVSPELATALVNAPDSNLRLKMVWENGKTSDATIGKGTVRAWKQIFQEVAATQSK